MPDAPVPSPRRFPAGFLWGTASSAHQVEGGNRNNDWWRFEQLPGAIARGDASGEACLHYEMFDEDFARARADGHNAHRFSIEWSRIEPERGRIDAHEVEHYHRVLASLRAHRLLPIVTLHHFTNPLWIADRGGWESPATVNRFCAFVRFCAREYGGEVDWWCTVNEPEVYAFRGWSEGLWPPARRDDSAALRVMANQLEAHGRAYRILHEEDRTDADQDGHAARVGFAKHHPQFEAARPWFPPDRVRAFLENRVFNDAVEDATAHGELRLSIPGARGVRRKVPELAGSLDYLGLNYYTRWMVRMFSAEPHACRAGAPLTDLRWEIYPRGFEQALVRVGRLGVPIVVTENGFADAHDAIRPRALVEHLIHLGNALARGVDVRGYMHWSLLDNFEWADGYAPRFGLYHVDFEDPQRRRTRRRSAEIYSAIVRANQVTDEIAAAAGVAL